MHCFCETFKSCTHLWPFFSRVPMGSSLISMSGHANDCCKPKWRNNWRSFGACCRPPLAVRHSYVAGGSLSCLNPYKVGPYPIITPINGLINRVITPFITRRGPLCRLLRKNWQHHPNQQQPPIHFGLLSFPVLDIIV